MLHLRIFWKSFFKFSNINEVLSGEQKKKKKNPLYVMPIGDPRDGFSYPTLTLMMDSYNVLCFTLVT